MGYLGGGNERGLLKTIDWSLVICYLILVLIGWVNIYASIQSTEISSIFDWGARSGKQFIWILTSLVLAGVILFAISPRIYDGLSIPAYILTICLLLAVIFLGIEVKGSRSWFEFGPIRFQPAEISKIATSLLLARMMSRSDYRITRMKDFIKTAFVILLPMLIIVAQSETGSALVYVGFIFMLYREGLSGWLLAIIGLIIVAFILTLITSTYTAIFVMTALITIAISLSSKHRYILFIAIPVLFLLGFLPEIYSKISENIDNPESFILKIKPLYILIGAICIAIPFILMKAFRERNKFAPFAIITLIGAVVLIYSTDFIFNNVLQDHQRKRIEVLLGIKDDPMGVGYNVNQAMIAIGSGGFSGKGFLNGTQTTYGFVPEQSTDFIFCTIGEEWGFLGCLVVLGLYVFLIWRITSDAEKSREAFTRIYGYCVACCLSMHLFINIGMTLGLMPVIGIPLPLISYGGSSLWGFTILIFIFISLYRNEKKYF